MLGDKTRTDKGCVAFCIRTMISCPVCERVDEKKKRHKNMCATRDNRQRNISWYITNKRFHYIAQLLAIFREQWFGNVLKQLIWELSKMLPLIIQGPDLFLIWYIIRYLLLDMCPPPPCYVAWGNLSPLSGWPW